MHPLVLDALSKGKEKVTGRINDVSRLDETNAKVILDSNQVIHVPVSQEKYEKLENYILEEAIFIGKFTLGILECDTVIFNKRPTNQ